MDDTPLMTRLREALASEDLAKGTVDRTLIDTKQFESFMREATGEGLDADDLRFTSVDLAEWRNRLQEQKMTPGTIMRKMQSLRKALILLDQELVVRLRWPKLPKQQVTSPSGFTRNERNSLLRACEQLSARDRAIVKMLLFTGARASTIAGAKLSKLNLGERSGSIEYDVAKNNRTYSVPLNVEAREALAAWLAVRPPVEHDHLFCAERFPWKPISRFVVFQVWHERLRPHLPKAVAERLHGPHQARHDLARRLLSGDEGRNGQPVPAADVAAIMGHSDPRVCVAIYSRPSKEAMRRALDRIVGEEEQDGDR